MPPKTPHSPQQQQQQQQDESVQNPDSSSEKLDVTEIEETTQTVREKDQIDDEMPTVEGNKRNSNHFTDEGINLSVKVRKAAITLVRQKDEVSSSEKDSLKCSRSSANNRHSDVWRPY